MAVLVDPIKPTLKPPITKRLKLECDILLSTFSFKFNLRRYNVATAPEMCARLLAARGRCLHSSTFQHILSRFWPFLHTKHNLDTL
jgi:hypothetical protein